MKGIYLSGLALLAFSGGCFLLTGAFGAPACGDGFLDAGEECDDGNNAAGDGCDAGCIIEVNVFPNCGDNVVNKEDNEECDDGNLEQDDECDPNCQLPGCDNGFAAEGEICFAKSDFAVGLQPRSVVLADFDKDLDLDVATANFGPGNENVTVLSYAGENIFDALTQRLTIDDKLNSIVAGDIDNDENLDIAVIAEDIGGGADLAFFSAGLGDGAFDAPISATGVDRQSAIVLGDLNGDGLLDIVIADQNTAEVAVLLQGNEEGFLTFGGPVLFGVAAAPTSLVVEDFNNDGILDLVSSNGASNNISLLLGNGDGTLAPAVNFGLLAGLTPQQVLLVDIDGDTDSDLVTANSGTDNIAIFLNNGGGDFSDVEEFDIGVDGDPRSVAAGDFNNDGEIDLVTANSLDNSISLLINDGADNFTPEPAPLGTGTEPTFVVTGDINGDTVPDIVVTNELTNNISVFFSIP